MCRRCGGLVCLSIEIHSGFKLFLECCINCGNQEDEQIRTNRISPCGKPSRPRKQSQDIEHRRCICGCGRKLPTSYRTRKFATWSCYRDSFWQKRAMEQSIGAEGADENNGKDWWL